MPEEFGIEKYLDTKFEEVQGAISGIHTRLDTINGRVLKVENEQAETRGAVTVWKWLAGMLGLPGLVAFIKAFLFSGGAKP